MNTYLKKCVAAAVAVMAMGGAADAYAQDASRGTVDLPTVRVYGWDNSYDIAIGGLTWTNEDYSTWEQSNSGGGEGGDGGSGGDPPADIVSCDQLRQRKPDNCPNPIPFPNSYDYGKELVAGGSAIGKLLYFTDHVSGVAPQANAQARRALEYHTLAVRDGFMSRDHASQSLLLSIQLACWFQHDADEPLRDSGWLNGPSAQEKKCVEALEQTRLEAQNTSFTNWFVGWLDRQGIGLGDFDLPDTLNHALTGPKSIDVKTTQAEKDFECAKWWKDAQASQCSVP